MDIGAILGIVLPIVYIIVGVALVWFVIELALTARRTRTTVDTVHEQIEPTLEHVNEITKSIEPVVAKVDPLMDRVALTVDAANLEIMRVDKILEDVSQMTGTVTKTLDTVDSVTSLPLDAVNSLTSKMRSIFKKPQASEESQRLGEQKAAASAAQGGTEPKKPQTPLDHHVEQAAEQMKQVQADVNGVKEEVSSIASSVTMATEQDAGEEGLSDDELGSAYVKAE